MSTSTAVERAKEARESFVSAASERGLIVQAVSETSVEWRFADDDPLCPPIRTHFITRAEAIKRIETAHVEAEGPRFAPTPDERTRDIIRDILLGDPDDLVD